ncbi:MAG: capsular polysaccharide synthesis protein [Sphingobacteriaceae bacterium]
MPIVGRPGYATFSDWFRIKLIHDEGGWWVDSDMLCINPFPSQY